MSLTNASSLIWSNYLDLQKDVKPWLQYPTGASPAQDPMLQNVIDMACQWVQNQIGRPVAPTRFDRRFDGGAGWEGAFLQLPYYPVLEILSVTEYWGVSGPHNLTEQTPTNQVDGYSVDYLRGELVRVFPGLVRKPWFPGERSIEVVWQAGFNPIPADIKMATLEFIAYWWRNTQQASRNLAHTADYDPVETSSGLWQGVPFRIIDLLEPYFTVGIA